MCLNFLFSKKKLFSSGRINFTDQEDILLKWQKVEELCKLGKPSQLKEAVITADKIIDFIFQRIYPKETVSVERYKKAKPLFPDPETYNDLWYAHKIRNELVHNLNFDLPYHEAQTVIGKYRQSLEILGVLK